jgi:nucleoid-associated protein EbfC
MFKGLANIASMMKNAKEIGSKMQNITEELKHKRATGRAGGDLVEVEVNGLGSVIRVKIDQTLIDNKDKEMIEELLPAAINMASLKAKELHAEALQNATQGMDMPGLQEMMSKMSDSKDELN